MKMKTCDTAPDGSGIFDLDPSALSSRVGSPFDVGHVDSHDFDVQVRSGLRAVVNACVLLLVASCCRVLVVVRTTVDRDGLGDAA